MKEAAGRTAGDQFLAVLRGVREDQDDDGGDAVGEPSRDVEIAFSAEAEVHQHDVGGEVRHSRESLRTRRGRADDGNSVTFEQGACGLQEPDAAIDEKTAQGYSDRGRARGDRAFRPAGNRRRPVSPVSWNVLKSLAGQAGSR